jgi:hypothetical protein
MNIQERVERAGRRLRRAEIAAGILEAVAVAGAVFVAMAIVDALFTLPLVVRMTAPPLAVIASVALLSHYFARRRAGADPEDVALWIEARFPTLQYALVTAVDPAYAGRVPEIERGAGLVEFEPAISRAVWRAISRPVIAVAITALVLLFLPAGTVARVATARTGDALSALMLRGRAVNPLQPVVVRVVPPEYSGIASSAIDDPATVHALVGSRLTIEGRSADDSLSAVTAAVGDHDALITINGDRWRLVFTMPNTATAVRFRAGVHQRLLVVEPVMDSIPVVTLTLPVRDSIYRRPSGSVRLTAELSDDLGLASGAFEYIISSGSGENFTFKSGTLGAASFYGKAGALGLTFRLDSLGLQPGDILHLRAVGRDRNNISGPGVGASETRTLRIARADEYDSVDVDAAPPPEPEKNALSQRMILMMTEALEKRRPTLNRSALLGESQSIAAEQTRLRKRVGQIIFARLGEDNGAEESDTQSKPLNRDSLLAAAERANTAKTGTEQEQQGDETPVVAINKPLLTAYNHMWQAASFLELGEPGAAVPEMKKALDALQVARAAERIYLRGNTRPVVVDIERVRLQGKDKGSPALRMPREALDPARAARLARFDVALTLAQTVPAAAADSLLLLRLEVIGHDDIASGALEGAANAIRSGKNVTSAVIRARRILTGGVERRNTISPWGTTP